MSISIRSFTIEKVFVVDDDMEARKGFSYPIEDLGLEAVQQVGSLNSIDEFVKKLPSRAAVFSDFRLRPGNYASFNGDQLISVCYQRGIPGILCTTYPDVDFLVNRRLLRYVPVFLRTHAPDPSEIEDGFRRCIEELAGNLQPSRKPWRTLVRVYEVDRERELFYVILPGWKANEKVRLNFDDLPGSVRPLIEKDKRLHAQVNLGADHFRDLYFDGWEAE